MGGIFSFGLLVRMVGSAALAKLRKLQALLERLLVLAALVIDRLALRALQLDEEILGHNLRDDWTEPYGKTRFVSRAVEPAVGFEPTTCCLQNSCSTPELRRHGGSTWWAEKGSNLRRREPGDLQSPPFDHFGICPSSGAVDRD